MVRTNVVLVLVLVLVLVRRCAALRVHVMVRASVLPRDSPLCPRS
ncbi:hypothetical protein [Streptomyces massasporeus]|nr:hypothetical protein [Streptomyces massasporeus]